MLAKKHHFEVELIVDVLEWVRMWPEWVKIMAKLRLLRLEETLYKPRRSLLVSEYEKYVMCPSPDSPTHNFLPHVVDLARFPLFRNFIRSLEDNQADQERLASAFARLPVLVDEWIQNLNSETAALVKIPSCLSISGGQNGTPSDTSYAAASRANVDKLHLACAVFHVGDGAFFHPEILSVLKCNDDPYLNHNGISRGNISFEDSSECTGSIYDRFRLQFLDEAPYIVYACGLDPKVATVDDMDRRNARLMCLCCGGHVLVMRWRHAVCLLFTEVSIEC